MENHDDGAAQENAQTWTGSFDAEAIEMSFETESNQLRPMYPKFS